MPSFGLPSARAEASRRNGAKSRGPKTPEGKARSAQNALRHGFRAQKFLLVADEDGVAFATFEAALLEELAPAGTLQSVLAQRLVVAAWRLNRADRMERDLLDEESGPDGDLGLALTRDGHGARVVPTLLRYRGAAMAESCACCARSRRFRPGPRLARQPRTRCLSPRRRQNQSNPSAAETLVIQVDRTGK